MSIKISTNARREGAVGGDGEVFDDALADGRVRVVNIRGLGMARTAPGINYTKMKLKKVKKKQRKVNKQK